MNITLLFFEIILPILSMCSTIFLIFMVIQYRRRCRGLKIACETLAEISEAEKNKHDEKLLEIAAIKQIYQGCINAERKCGVKIDFDGKVEITHVAKDGKEACAQIDALDKLGWRYKGMNDGNK